MDNLNWNVLNSLNKIKRLKYDELMKMGNAMGASVELIEINTIESILKKEKPHGT